jgi:hypothetical protein
MAKRGIACAHLVPTERWGVDQSTPCRRWVGRPDREASAFSCTPTDRRSVSEAKRDGVVGKL